MTPRKRFSNANLAIGECGARQHPVLAKRPKTNDMQLSSKHHISWDLYQAFIRAMPIACVDVVIMRERRALLMRWQEAQPRIRCGCRAAEC